MNDCEWRPPTESEVSYFSLDGMRLTGTLLVPAELSERGPCLLVHGITADRDEGGFYRDLANALAEVGIPSLRFDLRAHGRSGGTMEELTLSGCWNDVIASAKRLPGMIDARRFTGPPSIVASSFGGGLATIYAAAYSVPRLVLLNPNLDYLSNWLIGTPLWDEDQNQLSESACRHLAEYGWLPRGEFRMGRALVNEAFHFMPEQKMSSISTPTLVVHGTEDTIVPFRSSLQSYRRYRTLGPSCFLPVVGAEHGFIAPGDEKLETDQTKRFRQLVIEATVTWLAVTDGLGPDTITYLAKRVEECG